MKEIKHIHHIIPKHMGGTDDPSNLTEPISIEQHAEAHRILYETHGKTEDYIAWKCLEGSITIQEARIASSVLMTAQPVTVNNIYFESIAAASRYFNLSGKRIAKAVEENRDPLIRANSQSINIDGVFYSSLTEASKALGISRIKILSGDIHTNKRKTKMNCPHCGIIADKLNYSRWHGDNCKKKDTK